MMLIASQLGIYMELRRFTIKRSCNRIDQDQGLGRGLGKGEESSEQKGVFQENIFIPGKGMGKEISLLY